MAERPRRRDDDDKNAEKRPRPKGGGAKNKKPPPRSGAGAKRGAAERSRAPRAGDRDRRPRDDGPRNVATGTGRPARPGRSRDAGRDKRTSRNTDDRSPTRSGIQYPSRRYKQAGDNPPAPASPARPVLRTVRQPAPAPTKRGAPRRSSKPTSPRRRARRTEATEELAKIAGRRGKSAVEQLRRAAEAFTAGRERDALRLLRPLRDAYPDASAVRELIGLCHYRLGNYTAAGKELDAYVELSGSVDQHPVLMDCARAQQRHARVEVLWRELAETSPSGGIVVEGRIVLAGDLADRGRLRDAIQTLERRGTDVKRVQDHHLRLWYALADLYERAGEIPSARQLFERIAKADRSFADVAERLSSLA